MGKICTECGLEKSLDDFYLNITGKFGRESKCKSCRTRLRGKYVRTERGRATNRAWRDTYNGQKSEMWSRAKARAKKKSLAFTITHEDFEIPEFCSILGVKMESDPGKPGGGPVSPSLDRIDPALGYIFRVTFK